MCSSNGRQRTCPEVLTLLFRTLKLEFPPGSNSSWEGGCIALTEIKHLSTPYATETIFQRLITVIIVKDLGITLSIVFLLAKAYAELVH